MPSSPQSDIAPKDFYSSSGPGSGTGRSAEDTPPCQNSSFGSSRKRKKACKENGNGSPETLPSGENGTAEKQKPNMSKKSGVAKSAATSCHVRLPSVFPSTYVNLILISLHIQETQLAACLM
jgi:DEAD/DEAH box helicase domain-containing protein